MIPRFKPAKSKGPCSVCVKRKVKCDRAVPCSNCVKRGEEDKCIASYKLELNNAGNSLNTNKQEFLILWHAYSVWIIDNGLLGKGCQSWTRKLQNRQQWDWRSQNERADLWLEQMNMELSFKLLDYSVENLGGLYFGVLSDVGELYIELEEYWGRTKIARNDITPENYLWNALLWSILTLTVYYIPLKALETLMLETHLACMQAELQESGLTEQARANIAADFANVSLQMLTRANFMAFPDVKIIQTYLILASTSFPTDDPPLANSLLTHCLHLAKYWQLDLFKISVADTTDVRLTKLSCEKIWYRLCVHDYWQSGIDKPLSVHETNNSLLNHAAFLMDRPNVDVYQSEETFEALLWKVTSLDRDVRKYFDTQTKPPLKTLDAVQRQVDIFLHKAQALDAKVSASTRCEKFIVSFLLNVVNWKISNLAYTYYDQESGHVKLYQFSTMMIALIVHNIKVGMGFLNKLPFVVSAISKVLTFHSLCFVFDSSSVNEQLALDLTEICDSEDLKKNDISKRASVLAERLRELRKLWRNVRVVDDGEGLNHPVYTILRNDMGMLQESSRRQSRLLLKWDKVDSRMPENEENESQSRDFMKFVRDFEDRFSLFEILD
ncbi:LAME_0E04830g1_1 [Lachancea meyersii CBS 8951]|uniref:LAME_0E04830g1_1 n=1 Tax=Lachancea meyersii CBS 8951 TaxID=1266667 RepID=A0A1G4JH14_9SACH|nr:LAME_0E04830g1_1 [Lachancea meyersii CBS 8951]